jgi:hypothetical protein
MESFFHKKVQNTFFQFQTTPKVTTPKMTTPSTTTRKPTTTKATTPKATTSATTSAPQQPSAEQNQEDLASLLKLLENMVNLQFLW